MLEPKLRHTPAYLQMTFLAILFSTVLNGRRQAVELSTILYITLYDTQSFHTEYTELCMAEMSAFLWITVTDRSQPWRISQVSVQRRNE